MLTVGLTGDVGAGKSTLCRVFAAMGAKILDADSVARDMWRCGDVQRQAEARWGAGFFKGEWKNVLSKIADKIFSSEEEYKFASSLLHSATMNELKTLAESSASDLTIVEIPLLYECGVPGWIDGVIYAAAPLEKRVERNASRNWNKSEILRREAKLMPREEKIRRADWFLENTGTADEWEAKARELCGILLIKSKA